MEYEYARAVLHVAVQHASLGPHQQIVSPITPVDACFRSALAGQFRSYDLHITPNRLTKRCS